MNRRNFLRNATVATTALAGLPWKSPLSAENAAEKTNWPIGCFNRAWTKWSYDDALDGIKFAGYKLTGLLSSQRGEAFASSTATPEYLDGLKKHRATRSGREHDGHPLQTRRRALRQHRRSPQADRKRGASGPEGGVREAEKRGLQRPDHGRGRPSRRHRCGNNRQRARKPGVF